MAFVRRSTVVCLLLGLLPLGPGSLAAETPGPESVRGTTDSSARRGEAYAHLMRALFAARRGENRAASQEVKRAVELQPDSADVRVQGANLLDRMGRRTEALDLARQALEIDPDNHDTLFFLGDRAAERALGGNPDAKSGEEARHYYEELLRQGVEDDDMLGRLATLRLQAGDRAGAIDAARKLVARRPGDRRASGTLAQLLIEENRRTEALEIVLRFLGKHPNDLTMLQLANDLTRELDAWAVVDRVFSEHGEIAGRSGGAHSLWGEALLYLGEPERSAESLELALLARPGDPMVRFHLAQAYQSTGRFADAAVLFGELVEEGPEIPAAHAGRLLGETLYDQGDGAAAYLAFVGALARVVERPEAFLVGMRDAIRRRICLILIDEQRLDDAAALVADFEIADDPENLEVVAHVAMERKEWGGARQAVRSLEAAGEPAGASLIHGELLARTGRSGKAQTAFDEAIRMIGNRIRPRVAEVFHEVELPETGEQILREWTELEPESADAHYYLGSYLFRLEQVPEAEAEMREAFRLDPEHAPALNFLGYSYADRDVRLDEALELIQRALRRNSWSGAFLDSLGWVYFRLGRFEEAREPLERAAREHPKDPVVLEHLGDLYDRLDEPELAVAAWTRALHEAAEERRTPLREKIERVGEAVAAQGDSPELRP